MKVIIVGGVAAGASAAARLRRLDEHAEIIVIEKGQDISFANCGLPYYIGGIIEHRKQLLVQTPRSMHKRFNIDVRTLSEVTDIFPESKMVQIKNLVDGQLYQEKYDYLVLCTGAAPVVPEVFSSRQPNVFTVRNIPDSDVIKAYIESQRPESAVIVGGGFIGLEMAEMLHERGLKVAVVESAPQLLGALDGEMAAIVHRYLRSLGMELYLGQRIINTEAGPSGVEKIYLDSGKILNTELIVLGTGIRPETRLAKKAGIKLGSTGGILVDEYMRTSDPYIYAAGDVVQVKDFVTGRDSLYPLAGPANRQGWIVANNIAGNKVKYHGTQGTAIIRIKDMVIGVTGSNEKTLRQLGREYLTCHTHPSSWAAYYPGSSEMTIKIIFQPGDGKLLGAQIVGHHSVDKRIDVLATAIRAGMTVFDLQELELAYAPPFSSAKDPVNMIGYVAGNIINKMVDVITWDEVFQLVEAGAFLIDARTPKEYARGSIPGAVNIPVDELRENLDLIPKDKEILVLCQVGLRAYLANRILIQHGFKAKNIDGGYRLYQLSR
jgi:NADPH-dependent 2,4-dienoyl-CoA reductase/sulfur reductase-like enzyme/rhodanese-related sulfurtransferase